MQRALLLFCYISHKWNTVIVFYFQRVKSPWNVLCRYCVTFSACGGPARGTRSSVIVFYSWREEGRSWNALWRYCVIFSARGGPTDGTRAGIILLYFPSMERALAFLCYIFMRVERALVLF